MVGEILTKVLIKDLCNFQYNCRSYFPLFHCKDTINVRKIRKNRQEIKRS